jgi:hypothetical protein
VVRETVTASQYEPLKQAASQEYVPVAALAEELAAERRAWQDQDLEQVYGLEERTVKPEVWARLCDEAEQEIRSAVDVLDTRGKGKALKVRRDSFAAWLGVEVRPKPEWAGDYEVVSDKEWIKVLANRDSLLALRRSLVEVPLGTSNRVIGDAQRSGVRILIEAVCTKLKTGLELRWPELRTLEIIAGEIAEQFDGEDPFKPVFREAIEKAKASVQRLAGISSKYGDDVAIAEPADEELQEWRDLVERNS